MGKKASTPAAPDYTTLANQQAGIAKQNWQDTLTASRPNQTGPAGTNTWAQDPAGNWTNTVAMNPERQGLYDLTNQKATQQLQGYDTGQVNLSGAPAMPTVGGYNQQAIDTVRALQAPTLARNRAANEAKMAAMGIGTGSGSAWNAEQQNLGVNENQADLGAIMAGINQGNTEFSQGMGLHTTGTSDIFNQEQANQAKMAGMLGQSNTFTMPTFAPVQTPGMPGAVTPDLMGAANNTYQAQLAAANAKNAGGGLLGTVGGIAGGMLGSMAGPIGTAAGSAIGKSLFPA